MQFFFSNSTKGFYLVELHGSGMPDDAIGLEAGERDKALAWQSRGGLIAGVTDSGRMILADIPGMQGEGALIAAI